MVEKEKKIFDYAYELFQENRFDEALDAFILLYNIGYDRENIIKTIYYSYMSGNDAVFRESYNQHNIAGRDCAYEECLLDFIPYKEGEYYIFDKELLEFVGLFSINEIDKVEMDDALKAAEFSSVTTEIEWDWNNVKQILTAAKERKIYVICRDIKRAVSYCKIPELKEYMMNVTMFTNWEEYENYFHEYTSVYLPKVFYGSEESRKQFREILYQEHSYRLTPEGRNTENVLLTIGIPTHNRGNLVLKRLQNLLKMQYDAEIEIAISKNGTVLYEKEYEIVGKMQDARINYYDHKKDLRIIQNLSHIMEMAHGKYVLMISDEDDVVLGALEHYLRLLSDKTHVNLVRARNTVFYTDIEERLYAQKGLDAFFNTFLRQNYISGLIIRRKDFLEEKFSELKRFSDNVYYQTYPHDCWCAKLSMKGDYMEEPYTLISENDSALEEELEQYQKLGITKKEEFFDANTSLPTYAKYEERLKQFQGQIDFLHWMMDKCQEGAVIGLYTAIGKTEFLLEIAREKNYDCENFPNIIDKYIWFCMDAIDEFSLEEKQKLILLAWIKKCSMQLLKFHNELSVGKRDK